MKLLSMSANVVAVVPCAGLQSQTSAMPGVWKYQGRLTESHRNPSDAVCSRTDTRMPMMLRLRALRAHSFSASSPELETPHPSTVLRTRAPRELQRKPT